MSLTVNFCKAKTRLSDLVRSRRQRRSGVCGNEFVAKLVDQARGRAEIEAGLF